jgi:hypothetical protein
MRIPIETLIDGVVRTLLESVLPELKSRTVRGQLFAAVDVLCNVRDRVEVKPSLLEAEADSAQQALERAAAQLRSGGADDVAASLEARLAELPDEGLTSRVEALRAALVEALELVDRAPEAAAESARAALGEHLAAQAVREVSVLKPSMLEQISRG